MPIAPSPIRETSRLPSKTCLMQAQDAPGSSSGHPHPCRPRHPTFGGPTEAVRTLRRRAIKGGVRRGDFEDLVRTFLDEELEGRGFRLTPQRPADAEDEKPAAVYEADPDYFAERYPALDGRAGGNVPCVDLWVHLD